VIWLEQAEVGARLRLRVISPTTGASEPITVSAVSAGRSVGFPRVVSAGDSLIMAWTSEVGVMTVSVPPAVHPAG
jgi:hypothetical protein